METISDYNMTEAEANRFWIFVRKDNGCWIWCGAKVRGGYGGFSSSGRTIARAHRVAWYLTYGPICEKMFVLHRCDNPSCVNPEHLFLGTTDDNMKDMIAKRRSPTVNNVSKRKPALRRGENNKNSKLSYVDVYKIREKILVCPVGGKLNCYNELAKEYGVSFVTIERIANNRAWKIEDIKDQSLTDPKYRKLNNEEISEIVRLYKAGQKQALIARELNVTSDRVHYLLRGVQKSPSPSNSA